MVVQGSIPGPQEGRTRRAGHMGEHDVLSEADERQTVAFTQAVLSDLLALEKLLETDALESGVRRIGAEQEMFLVSSAMRPAPLATEVLKRADDPRLTTEIGLFNLEGNLSPQILQGRGLHAMEDELHELVRIASEAATGAGASVVLTGILPTLRLSDLSLQNITPSPRYHELNRVLTRLRGGAFEVHINGVDELQLTHDNVMLEACNTSFQVHLQVGAKELASHYNMAQAVTAPVLAAAVNSPLLFSRRLWQETRLALFQHSADARAEGQKVRSQPGRVSFGEDWVNGSIIEIFREDVARFRILLTKQIEEDSMAVLGRGEVPALKALRLHNGTVWRWNRPCYGILDGRPSLRIENRVLPSGPTILDEMANAAFFLGLMVSLPDEYGDIRKSMTFEQAKGNFFAAARHGLGAQLAWVGGRSSSAAALILEHLLPLARAGLKASEIDAGDIDRYLGVLEERVRSEQTGAEWALRSFAAMGNQATPAARDRALTAAMLANGERGEPVHRWPLVDTAPATGASEVAEELGLISHFMKTDLFTVRPDAPVDLVASLMDWKHIRHVPVEDDEGRLLGVISHRSLLRMLAGKAKEGEPMTARSLMTADPVTVGPNTSTLEAIQKMRDAGVGCLPVVDGERLVGIVTAHDFLTISANLLEERLKKG